jgi:Amidohydrolase family
MNMRLTLLLAVSLFASNVALAKPDAAPAAPTKAAAQTTTHTITAQSKVAGKQTVKSLGGGKYAVEYSYRDNGRGPDVFEEIEVASDGAMNVLNIKGKSTFGAPIAETYSRTAGAAKWKSSADEGTANNVKSALYIPIESSLEPGAIAIRALLRAPGQTLPALPSGQITLSKLAEADVMHKAAGSKAPTGQRKKVVLYQLTGISLTPQYVWMWSGANPGLFGVVNPGFSIVQEGYEHNADALLKKQLAADAAALKKLAEKHTKRMSGVTVIRNVRWFDSETATMKGPNDIFVNRGRIAGVFAPNGALEMDATVIDGTSRTLLPGLTDLHGHTSPWDSLMQIAGGVTLLRDMGNDNQSLNELKTQVDAGTAIGPHIVPTGFIEGESPFSANLGFVVKDVDGAKKAIDWYSQNGYRQIKLYNSMRPEWVAPVAAYAKLRGMRVSGHIPAFMRAEEAVRAGFDEIQHINQVFLNFLVKKEDDTRTLLRFYLVGDNANQIDLESKAVKDFIALLKEKGTSIDPTMTAFEAMFLQKQGAPNPSYGKISKNVPPTLQRAWLTNSMDVNDKNAEPFRKSYEKLMAFVKMMHDAGVPLVSGTDDIAGFTLHRELELYVAAGISANDALKIATWNGAKYSQVLERTGSITAGKDADLILVEGDPTKNISDIRKISLVMKAGDVYLPADMYQSLGVKPFASSPKIEKVNAPKKQ